MILDRFRSQLDLLEDYFKQAEARGDGVQVTLSLQGNGECSPPKVAIFPNTKLTEGKRRT